MKNEMGRHIGCSLLENTISIPAVFGSLDIGEMRIFGRGGFFDVTDIEAIKPSAVFDVNGKYDWTYDRP